MVKGSSIESNRNIQQNHQSHSEDSSISDEIEIINPILQHSFPTKQENRLKKDPKFLSEQVEVFNKKNQTYKTISKTFDENNSDGKPLKFVSSRPLFVYRNEARKKHQQQQQNFGNGIGYAFVHSSFPYPNPYPYPYSYYTHHGVYHYLPPSGR